jgi:hypothetical protein
VTPTSTGSRRVRRCPARPTEEQLTRPVRLIGSRAEMATGAEALVGAVAAHGVPSPWLSSAPIPTEYVQ